MKHLKLFIVILVIAIVGMSIAIYINIDKKPIEEKKAEYNSVDKICEFATLKCYYNNVATEEYDSKKIFNYGDKKYWIEYSGIVEYGINVNEVQINNVDENGVIKIFVPDAKILNIYYDETSVKDLIYDKSWGAKITSQDQANTLAKAQSNMETEAAKDTNLLSQAKNNAKKLLEQYVINVSKQIGQEVTVEWIDQPIVNE